MRVSLKPVEVEALLDACVALSGELESRIDDAERNGEEEISADLADAFNVLNDAKRKLLKARIV